MLLPLKVRSSISERLSLVDYYYLVCSERQLSKDDWRILISV